MKKSQQRLITLLCLFILTSCASKPKLYPNSHLKAVGKEKANKDIDQCISDADEYLESDEGKRIVKSAGKGAAFGAAVGAAFGLFTGNVGEGLTRGAVVGGVSGGAGEALSPDELKRRYVTMCLTKQGYEVLGWN